MLRIILSSIAALILIGATAWSANGLIDQRRALHEQEELQRLRGNIAQEEARWRQMQPDGAAEAGSREEALRTLQLLRELDEQERRLWDYYRAVDAREQVRSRLIEERAALQRRVQQHESRLHALERSTEALRPPEAAIGSIDFSDAAASPHPHDETRTERN